MFKTAKGTQDFYGSNYEKIKTLIEITEQEFQSDGGEPLETPVFERVDILMGKYGEEADTKLIYRLEDEGGELLALRYDLTVPFYRFIKENSIKKMRRYSIGKVYRRDQPNNKTGRYREFYQADFDIYGEKQECMIAEVTLLNCICRIFDKLGLQYTILINDIRNLRYLLSERLGLKSWKEVCPIIDKLDKQNFSSLEKEFSNFGLDLERQKCLEELLEQKCPFYESSASDYSSLLELADIFGFKEKLIFTNSLARGLDYYTGFIWEFKISGFPSTVCAGGRYDDLLGAPAVGISLGISRIAPFILDKKPEWKDVYRVVSVGNVDILDKMRIVNILQKDFNYSVQYSLATTDGKLAKIITECCKTFIRYVVIAGEDELKNGLFIIKDLKECSQRTIEMSDK